MKLGKKLARIVVVLTTISISACATTVFQKYEARNDIVEGRGGTRTSYDGVDFWTYGDPPQKYKILGIIDDDRPGGLVPMARMKGDIAAAAKANGGDAVIVINNESRVKGYVNSFSASASSYGNSTNIYGGGVSVPVRENTSRFVVIKYLGIN